MTGNEYQELSMRTNDGLHLVRLGDAINIGVEVGIDISELINGCLGLAGETGEFCDMVKKFIFHKANLDHGHAKKEIGDVMWYVALICHAFGWSLDEILQMNVDKLKARYPEGFDTELSNHRKQADV